MWIFNEKQEFLIRPHGLTNFEIQKYYQNEPRFTVVYSRDNLPDKIKDGAYIINLGVEHIPEETKIFIDKSVNVANIFRIQAYDSIMCGYFCIGLLIYVCRQERKRFY